ncbi:MAG: hypothetical protein MJE77_16745, partial [Proteobacteria bacterium]|nr:hypothetical protein [Pseudomonadota bacterium]
GRNSIEPLRAFFDAQLQAFDLLPQKGLQSILIGKQTDRRHALLSGRIDRATAVRALVLAVVFIAVGCEDDFAGARMIFQNVLVVVEWIDAPDILAMSQAEQASFGELHGE